MAKHTTHNIHACSFTREAIRNMLSYCTDEKIASYTKAPLALVQAVRRSSGGNGDRRHNAGVSRLWETDNGDNGGSEYSDFKRKTRASSDRLVAALEAMRG